SDSFSEGIRRANMYAEAGADIVMLFPNTIEEACRAPVEVRAPLIFVNSEGNRFGRPIFSIAELETMGYKMANDAIIAIMVTFKNIKDLFSRLHETGRTGMDQIGRASCRERVEAVG